MAVLTRDALLAEIAGIRRPGARARRPKKKADRVRLPKGIKKGAAPGEFVNVKDGSVLVWVPPGAYGLGTAQANPERNHLLPERAHELERGFYMGKHPVTWKQFTAFCLATGRKAPRQLFPAGDDHPVHGVSLADARAYCSWLAVTRFTWPGRGRTSTHS